MPIGHVLRELMEAPRIIITGLRGGAGKTLLALGLTRALHGMGTPVKPYKKGPDYIDAAWLARAALYSCTNLDPFFLSGERLRALVAHTLPVGRCAVIEGNRGLFDGRDVEGSCSTAELARVLDCPVLLSLDCTKMTRTAAAVVAGLAHFEPGVPLAGVVLNHVASERHESIVRRAIETYTDVPVLGALPRLRRNPLPERHMGLTDCTDTLAVDAVLEQLAALVRTHVDISRVSETTRGAAPLPAAAPFWPVAPVCPVARPRIGYVRDAALWFYYDENLEALRRAGAELVELSLLSDSPWPKLDGLYLGGGFPEELAETLSCSPHLGELRALSERNVPLYAECGGFMVLAQAIVRDGREYPMAGVFPVRAEFHAAPQGLGYVEATVMSDNPFHPTGAVLRGHEFHYSRCLSESDDVTPRVLRLHMGKGMGGGEDGLLIRNTFAAYMHCYAPSMPHWAERFAAMARTCNPD